MLHFWRPPRLGLLVVFAVMLAVLYLFYGWPSAVFAGLAGALCFAYGRHSCNDNDLDGFH